jgi:hypothetical protein
VKKAVRMVKPAEQEMFDAAVHYELQVAGLGQDFLARMTSAVADIGENPKRWPSAVLSPVALPLSIRILYEQATSSHPSRRNSYGWIFGAHGNQSVSFGKGYKCAPRRINEIVHGKRSMTADAALRLGRFFGRHPSSG